jgi:hypothetical protein
MTLGITKLSIMTQHNNTQRNDTQHNDNQHNDTKHIDNQHFDTLHNDIHVNDTEHIDSQHNDNQHDHKNLILSIMIHACWVSLWQLHLWCSIVCSTAVGLNKFKIQFYVKIN